MRPLDDPAAMTAHERLSEVAAILAAGILRLHSRAALPTKPDQDSVQDCLEVPTETVLTVHSG
ncbi:MAG: hypothetical protein ACJ8FY_00650 [Gemmataceae bacterium]